MNRVFIVHGWGGTVKSDWYAWLKRQLELKGFLVTLPQLPDTHVPRIEKWIRTLAKAVGSPGENTYFIGHSLGCQTIARYLETLPTNAKIGGAIFVAGFFDSLFRDGYDSEDMETSDIWLQTPVNLTKVKSHIIKSVAYFSQDDPDVPITNKDKFEKELGAEVIVLNGYRHFNTNELPIILEKLLEITK